MHSIQVFLTKYQIVLISLLALVVRLLWINQPMRWDESFSYNHFIDQSLPQLFYYMEPNNHVLYNLLVKVNTLVLGNAPWSLRFWAMAAGVASVWVFYKVCRDVYQLEHVWLGAMFIACSPFLVLYATNARGYSLQFLLMLLAMWLQKDFFLNQKSRLAIIVLSALLLFVLPTSVLFIAPLWLLLIIRAQRANYLYPLKAFILLCVLTAVFYAPVVYISGINKIVSNPYVASIEFNEFYHRILDNVMASISSMFREMAPGWFVISAILIAMVLAFFTNKKLFLHSVIFVSGAFTVIALKRVLPFDRVYIVILPIVIVLLTFLFQSALRAIKGLMRSVFAVGFGLYLVFTGFSAKQVSYHDTGVFPEAQSVAIFISLRHSTEAILAHPVQDEPLFYYLRTSGIYEKKFRNTSAKAFSITKIEMGDTANTLMQINDSLALRLVQIESALSAP